MTGKNLCFVLVLFVALSACKKENLQNAPIDLTVSEGFINPIGFYSDKPTFSWKLPAGIKAQSAYSIAVASSPDLLPNKADLWESGKVESDQTLFVKYQGKALSSKDKIYWKVKFWDESGSESDWSETANLEIGLLNNNDWKGNWISLPTKELQEKDERGSLLFRPQYLRKEIVVDAEIISARLYITAKGVYEAFINGEKVGTDVMSPGWTPVTKSISTLTYDVTNLLDEGQNTIGAVVAEGWHSGRINLRETLKTAEHTPRLLCQLEIETKNGTKTIVSDGSWKVTQNGPIRISKIYDGETYDANYELGYWSKNDYNDSSWLDVAEQQVADSILLLPKRYEGAFCCSPNAMRQ